MSGSPGSFRRPLDAAVAEVALRVDRDTVLEARNALLAEAQRLKQVVRDQSNGMQVGLCGGDPISPEAAAAFNRRIRILLDACEGYCNDLEQAAHALDATARSYGYTDEEIAASFRGRP